MTAGDGAAKENQVAKPKAREGEIAGSRIRSPGFLRPTGLLRFVRGSGDLATRVIATRRLIAMRRLIVSARRVVATRQVEIGARAAGLTTAGRIVAGSIRDGTFSPDAGGLGLNRTGGVPFFGSDPFPARGLLG